MADSHSVHLTELTKEDFKMMAKQREKAKRDQSAKQSIATFSEPSMPASVSFPAPVKVTGEDEDRGRLMCALGTFEEFSTIMRQSGLNNMVGVERQPATPLPGKNVDKSFFKSSSASRPLHYPSSNSSSQSRPSKSSANSHNSANNNKSDGKHKPASMSSHGAEGKTKSVPSGYVSRTHEHGASKASSSSDRSSLQSSGVKKSDQKPESFSSRHEHNPASSEQHKSVERNQNHAQSTRKEPVHQSIKHQPIKDREPILQMLGHSSSNFHQSEKSNPKSSSSKPVAKVDSKTADSRAVLKEKEENRNSDVLNGAKVKKIPKLHIPENVEEMLKEFELPQPLTGIQTPKDSKFPFQDTVLDRKDLNVVRSSKQDLMKVFTASSSSQKEPVRTIVPEEIQEKDSSSSSESGSDSSSEDEADGDGGDSAEEDKNDGFDLDGMIGGVEPAKKSAEPVKPAAATIPRTIEKKEYKNRFVAEKVPPLSSTTHDTEKQRMEQSCSSSDSSSSDSESESDSGSESESDKDVSEDEPEHSTPQGTPNNIDNMNTKSPVLKKWGLSTFLQKPQELINSKPPSCEAPASDKSDPDHFQEDTSMKRAADNVSDENPPSNDMLLKPMSADEFSPPTILEHKNVLSPIKSPPAPNIKSPIPAVVSPLHYRGPKVAEKVGKSSNVVSESVNVIKAADSGVKCKDNNNVVMNSSLDVTKGRKSRKQKPKFKSVDVVNTSSDSESESEIDVVNASSDSALESPMKALPQNLQKSPKVMPLDSSLCSTKPSTSSAKRKESKRDKLLKERDSVKLKEQISSSVVPSIDCDSRKLGSRGFGASFPDHIDDMLIAFPEQKPVSPIRSLTNLNNVSHTNEDLVRAGLAVSTVKPIPVNRSISCATGKPSVLVKIDLNLLGKVLCLDRESKDFLKPKEHLNVKHHKKVTSAKTSLPNVTKSKKVLDDTSKDKISKSTASKLSANNLSDMDASDRKYVPEKERVPSLTQKDRKKQVNPDVPEFDLLPVREPLKPDNVSDNVSESDSSSSDSDIDDTNHRGSVHESLSSSNHSSFSHSPSDKKKRKLDNTREDDSKRRKTLSKSHQSATENKKEVQHVEPSPAVLPNRSQPVESSTSSKRERHGSASSQHSTVSNISQRSSHSQRSTQSHRSQKRQRTQDETSQGLRPSSSAIGKSHDRSKTAVVTPVVKNEMNDTPWLNGFVPEPSVHNPTAMAFHRSMLTDKEEEERMLSADDYHRKAKKYKYQADDMDTGLRKYVLYLESVLCFIQCGYAMEKDHMITESSNMYKDTYKFVSHQYHQFRIYYDSELAEQAHKLTVLCLRIQSLIYLKLYMLKKNETVKLKRILEDHNSKSAKPTSQPKAPSAPSPHQPSWNRSTGTPSPMSPTPSPANSVCSVGSVGSDITPSKISNGSNGQGQIAPPGSVIVPQRIHSITQKYFSNTCYLIQAHELWDQAGSNITTDNKEFFAQLDLDCGPLTLHSSLLHLVRYVKQAISQLNL